jgi:hypothetical protein
MQGLVGSVHTVAVLHLHGEGANVLEVVNRKTKSDQPRCLEVSLFSARAVRRAPLRVVGLGWLDMLWVIRKGVNLRAQTLEGQN